MVSVDKAEFLLCSLGYGDVLQQPLDLMFTEGEEVTFFLNGNGKTTLTGRQMTHRNNY
jgi:FK506-binding nuclear protein